MKIGIAVYCTVCHLRKNPRGRSAPIAIANSLCDRDCEGYALEPRAGDLWPGETEEDFGYPIGPDGVEELFGDLKP